MHTSNRHYGEHITYPAHKGMPKTIIADNLFKPRELSRCSTVTKRVLKKMHRKRSRQFLKKNLEW